MKNARDNKREPVNSQVLRRWSPCAVLVIVAVCVGIYLYRDMSQDPGKRYLLAMLGIGGGYTTPSLHEVSQLTSLQFPPSARLVESRLYTWLSQELLSNVEIDRAEVDPFVEALPPQSEISHTSKLGITNDIYGHNELPPWWNPNSAKTFIATIIRMPLEDYHIVNEVSLLIDMDSGQQVIIYLFWVAE